MRRHVGSSLALVALCLGISAARASQVRSVNLEEMTQKAATIFAGRCIEVETVTDPAVGAQVSVARFEVRRAVKGTRERFVTVRTILDSPNTGSVAEVPGFRRGDEVVLFLYGESALGLRSTVGLGQGRFRVTSGKHGRSVATNDLGNRNLLREVSPAATRHLSRLADVRDPGEDLGPDDLLDMAEALSAREP